MCGISGLIGFKRSGEESRRIVKAMTDAIAYRGPDAEGHWVSSDGVVVLGHRRLSILDLSPTGAQPMRSNSGRYVLVFNGEIYNFKDLKAELPGDYPFRGSSDTEVLLALIEKWGIRKTIEKCVGMFAMALWDEHLEELCLVRDRIGEKPLYYGFSGGDLVFASELKALRRHPDFDGDLDREALTLYFRHNYVPAPYSIYRGIVKLRPGHLVVFRKSDVKQKRMPDGEPYWRLKDHVRPKAWREDEAIAELDRQLRRAVGRQMMADVPVGCLLSGGVDSTAVTAVMQSLSPRPVKSFTIGFHEEVFNEAHYAKAIAGHLGTDHTEMFVTAEEARAVIPQLPTIYDEPFADSSQIPTILVSRLARSKVTVCLSGDGGDEFFAGYNRYGLASRVWQKLGLLPYGLRQAIASGLDRTPAALLNGVYAGIRPALPKSFHMSNPADKLQKASQVLGLRSFDEVYERLISHWPEPSSLVRCAIEPARFVLEQARGMTFDEDVTQAMYLDAMTYLPDDILCKVDRASMANSLESRVPMLDHQLVEFAWSLPLDLKLRGGHAKWILKQVLFQYVPETLIERPKMGFGVPIGTWLRGPLREWASDLLAPDRLEREGNLNAQMVLTKFEEHLSGKRNWSYQLWDVLMFQAWYASLRQ